MGFIDLTHRFDRSMPVFPGDRTPMFQDVATIEKNGYNAVRIETGMHIGTHMDAPLHMLKDGKKLNDFDPGYFTGRAVCVDVRGMEKVDERILEYLDTTAAEILLLWSGWDEHFGTDKYYQDYPEISAGLAESLIDTSIRMIGMDWPSPDRAPYKVHRILLGNDILIIENLRGLDQIPMGRRLRFFAFPYTYDLEGSPVRALVEL